MVVSGEDDRVALGDINAEAVEEIGEDGYPVDFDESEPMQYVSQSGEIGLVLRNSLVIIDFNIKLGKCTDVDEPQSVALVFF